MRILLTRPEADSQKLAAQLRMLGHEVVVSPVMIIVARDSLPAAAGFDGVVATSANVFTVLPEDSHAKGWNNLPLYCVGARTAEAALARGFQQPEIVSADSATLASALRQSLQSETRLLYLAAKDRKGDLEDALASADIHLEIRIVYEAIAATALSEQASSALAGGQIDIVLHFSWRSAALFTRLVTESALVQQASAARHVCISADVASALEPLRLHAVDIAGQPDTSGILQCLQS